MIASNPGAARIDTQTFELAQIGASSNNEPKTAQFDLSHMSFYNGALSEAQIQEKLAEITPP